jgi:hypothetical protein
MKPDEFEFWQKAYLAALASAANNPDNYNASDCTILAAAHANDSVVQYRAAKATVVKTTYATAD